MTTRTGKTEAVAVLAIFRFREEDRDRRPPDPEIPEESFYFCELDGRLQYALLLSANEQVDQSSESATRSQRRHLRGFLEWAVSLDVKPSLFVCNVEVKGEEVVALDRIHHHVARVDVSHVLRGERPDSSEAMVLATNLAS